MRRQRGKSPSKLQKQCGGTPFPVPFARPNMIRRPGAWNVEVDYFERKLNFKIDAKTGNVSAFKINKATEKK
jgi:hypothetical protein